MNYSPRNAIRHLSASAGIALTDEEVTEIIATNLEAIEESGRAVRAAAVAYEELIIQLASAAVARRPTPVPEVPMHHESSQRSN